jgi:MOSC domain-containing protein YiiM
MTAGTICAVYLAPDAEEVPVAVPQVRAVLGRGLEGDRYFLGQGTFSRSPGEGRQVTLIEAEALEAVRREHGLDLGEGRSRRNLVTTGIRLADLVGRRFRVGTALLRGVRLCPPCDHLERLVGPGLLAALEGRGGLRADVLEEGTIRPGDGIEVLPS